MPFSPHCVPPESVAFARASRPITRDRILFGARRRRTSGSLWLVQLQSRPDAPSRPWPNTFGTWGGPPLSAADPHQFRKYFEPLFARLDAAGVTLAGFELGNEINTPMFNSDFSMPAENPAHWRIQRRGSRS
jgi:hypothetical protein